MSDPTEPHDCHDGQMIEMLVADNRRLRQAGCALAEASLHVISEHDGLHRLALAVSVWAKAVADEGGRGETVDLMRDLETWFGKSRHVPPHAG